MNNCYSARHEFIFTVGDCHWSFGDVVFADGGELVIILPVYHGQEFWV